MKKTSNKNKNFDNLLKSSISAVESTAGESEPNMSGMSDYLSEYLKCFILMGYDTKEESVVIIGGKTPQDYDSIETLLKRISNIDFFKDIQEEK